MRHITTGSYTRTSADTIGMRMVQVAELLVTLVRRETMIQIMRIIAQPSLAANTDSCSAIHSDIPDSWGSHSAHKDLNHRQKIIQWWYNWLFFFGSDVTSTLWDIYDIIQHVEQYSTWNKSTIWRAFTALKCNLKVILLKYVASAAGIWVVSLLYFRDSNRSWTALHRALQ